MNQFSSCSSSIGINRFDSLSQPKNYYLATYLWIDSSGKCIRLKTRTLDTDEHELIQLSSLPWWDSAECDTDRYLEPVRIFNDPFYPNGNNKLVLCETYNHDKTIPSKINSFFKKMNNFHANIFNILF